MSQLVDECCFAGGLHSRRACVILATTCFNEGLQGVLFERGATLQQVGWDTRSVLRRFLRARDFDLKAAIKMYNEYCTEVRP